jgi:hypothetical protein
MSCVAQLIVCLALIVIGLAVLVGKIKPHEALAQIGMLLVFLLLGPAIIAVVVRELLLPIATALWSAAKSVLVLLAMIFGLLLLLSGSVGAMQLYRNRNSGEHHVRSGEE